MQFTFVSKTVLSMLALAGVSLAGDSGQFSPGMVYTMTNAVSGNNVMAFSRGFQGQLSPAGSFATGGSGTGAGLGSQGSLTLSRNQQWLFAVNAGSNQLSVFAVSSTGLSLTDVVSTGGTTPDSVDSFGGLVYVVHSGSDNIAGFKLSPAGKLTAIPGSVQPLSGTGVGPAEISFDPEGETLVVTEKNTNLITTFQIGSGGVAGSRQSLPSSGIEPFGFGFAKRRQLIVSEAFGGAANASATSSYRLQEDGTLKPVTASFKNGQTAACWVIIDGGGRFAFVSNTGSNTLSSYLIEFDGVLALIQGAAAQTGAGPADPALSADGRLLYTLNGGDGSISAYGVLVDGRLASISSGVTGLPAGTVGLAAM